MATALAGLAPAPARAGAPVDAPAFPVGALAHQPLTLPQGQVELEVPVDVNLSRGAAGKPVTVPLAVTYGLTGGLSLGVIHAGGLCLSGSSGGCRRVYDDVGGRARVDLLRAGDGELATEATVLASRFDHVAFDSLAGLVYKQRLGAFAGLARVDLAAALTDREKRLYREVLSAALEAQWDAALGLSAFARLGVAKPLEVLSPFEIAAAYPVAVGVQLAPARHVEVGAELRFPDLLGTAGGGDLRAATVFARLFL